MVTLNEAVALAMVDGPSAGLDLLGPWTATPGCPATTGSRPSAPPAGDGGDPRAARAAYRNAARTTTSLPERRYLDSRAARLDRDDDGGA